MTENLPRKLVRRIAGVCQHCSEPAVVGADYCAEHGAKAAEYANTWTRNKRQARAEAGECITGCGRRVKVSRRDDGTAKLKRCKRCTKEHRGAMKTLRAVRGVETVERGVESNAPEFATRGRTKLDTGDRREGRNAVERYTTDRGRGAPTTEERHAELLRDVEYARQELGRFVRAFSVATSEDVQQLPRTQREEAMRLAASHSAQAARLLASVHDRLDKRGRAQCCVCSSSKSAESLDSGSM